MSADHAQSEHLLTISKLMSWMSLCAQEKSIRDNQIFIRWDAFSVVRKNAQWIDDITAECGNTGRDAHLSKRMTWSKMGRVDIF